MWECGEPETGARDASREMEQSARERSDSVIARGRGERRASPIAITLMFLL